MFAVMALCPQHTFQVLTKRPMEMLRYFVGQIPLSGRDEYVAALAAHIGKIVWDARGSERHNYFGCGKVGDISNRRAWPGWPLPNVWLGVSAEDQPTADERIPLLLQTLAAVRFVSYEPALGPVDFEEFPLKTLDCGENPGIDWIIVGGESGHGARPFNIQWARNTIEQCNAAGVACFVKQFGAKPYDGVEIGTGNPINGEDANWQDRKRFVKLHDRKGGDWNEWEPGLRVREFPE